MTNATPSSSIDSASSMGGRSDSSAPTLKRKSKRAAVSPPQWLSRAVPWVVIAVLGIYSILHYRDLKEAQGAASIAHMEVRALEEEKRDIKDRLSNEIVALSTNKSTMEARNKVLAEERDSLEAKLQATSSELADVKKHAEASDAQLAQITSELASTLASLESTKSQLATAGEHARKLNASLEESDAKLEALTKMVKAAEENVEALKVTAKEEATAHQKAKRELEQAIATSRKDAEKTKTELASAMTTLAGMKQTMEELRKENETIAAAAAAAQKEAKELGKRLAELEAAAGEDAAGEDAAGEAAADEDAGEAAADEDSGGGAADQI